jgi:G3E family GTPase
MRLVADNLTSKEDLVSMDRGCVCCSLRHDVVRALGELQARGDARGAPYDAVLLETTGLADPAPVAFTFFSNAWISAHFRLDSILCLVDAQHVAETLGAPGAPGAGAAGAGRPAGLHEAANQIAFADVVLLNKTDLVDAAGLQAARDLVRSINVTADVVETQLAGGAPERLPDWEKLMGINSFSIERALTVDPGFMDSDSEESATDEEGRGGGSGMEGGGEGERATKRARADAAGATPAGEAGAASAADEADAPAPAEGGDAGAPCGNHPGHCADAAACADPAVDAARARVAAEQAALAPAGVRRRRRVHDASGVGSVGITATGPLDRHRFNAFMRDLLAERARDVLRCKGVLCIKGQEGTKFVFQGVHETVCFGPAEAGWGPDEPRVNQIVFIGRALERAALLEGLRSCVWVPLPEGWAEHADARSGQPFFVHAASGKKQWERPAGAAPPVVKATERQWMRAARRGGAGGSASPAAAARIAGGGAAPAADAPADAPADA